VNSEVAIVTGATRGLGLETARQLIALGWSVLITGRDLQALRSAAARLNLRDYYQLDVADRNSVAEFRDALADKIESVTTLINNAGVYPDASATILDVTTEKLIEAFATNTAGSLAVTQAVLPSMIRARRGTIVNVSSESGQISSMGFDTPAYRLSKLALNGITVMLSHAVSRHGIRVNSICPGWCRTDMGGSSAPRSAEEGAADIVWLATSRDRVSGKFFVQREVAALIIIPSLVISQSIIAQGGRAPATGTPEVTQRLASFGGLKIGDAIGKGWTIREISLRGNEVPLKLSSAKTPLTIVFSLQKGRPGAFDREGVRIYYPKTSLPAKTIQDAGNSLSAKVAAFAKSRGGLKTYLSEVVSLRSATSREATGDADVARRFLDRLQGKWRVSVLESENANAAPATTESGTATRERFLNDLMVREDTDIGPERQFMTVGCTADGGRCWIFVVDSRSNESIGGYATLSEDNNALRLLSGSGGPIAVLKVLDDDHDTLEFFDASAHRSRSMRYERVK